MNKNGLYIILGILFSLVVIIFLAGENLGYKKAKKPVQPAPYAHLVNDDSPLFLQEKDIFQVHLGNQGIKGILFTEVIGVGVNSPDLEKYRFSVKLEDTLPGNGIINPKKSVIEMNTLYKKKYNIPWSITESKGEKKVQFVLDNVPAIDASAFGSCCKAATGAGCNNSCGQACSIEFEYQADFDINPDKVSAVRFSMTPSKVEVGKKTSVTLTVTVNNKKLSNYKLAYYIPLRASDAKIKTTNYPRGFKAHTLKRHSRIKGRFDPKALNTFYLHMDVTPSKKGTIEIPVMFKVSGTMDELLSKPLHADTKRKVVRNTTGTKFIWIGDGVLQVI